MRQKTISSITIAALFLSCLTFFTGCFFDDMALVTIHIQGRNNTAATHPVKPPSLVDRILMLFSAPAYAWEPDPGDVRIVISAPGMDTINIFPVTSGSLTREVPAGVPVTIEATSVVFESEINYGARSTVTLTPGQESTIVMKMIPVSRVLGTSGSPNENISLQIDDASPHALAYRIYRSSSPEGPYTLVSPQPVIDCTSGCYGVDITADFFGGPYYYKVSVISEHGEGLLGDSYEHLL